MSGWYASSARRTARAEPGPWCLTPSSLVSALLALAPLARDPGSATRGPVEVAPPVALAHHRLQVLLPHDGVGHRVLDHRADDAGRHVRRAQYAVTEVCRQRNPVDQHGDRLRGGHRAAG